MPETFASTLRDMPRSARMVRTRWPSCSRKPVSESGFSVMSPGCFRSRHSHTAAILVFGQTNFAKAPSIKITLRLQLFGFDERFDPAGYKIVIGTPWLFKSDGDGDIGENAGNLEKSRFATRQDGLID